MRKVEINVDLSVDGQRHHFVLYFGSIGHSHTVAAIALTENDTKKLRDELNRWLEAKERDAMNEVELTHCTVCDSVCDESGLCDEHKYDEQLTDTP